jgi:hypothetical protein
MTVPAPRPNLTGGTAVAVLVYATEDDLSTWLDGDPPVNAAQLLRSASLMIRRATNLARYDVDLAGKPADPELVAAFRDATCAQVSAWAAAGIVPGAAGLDQSSVISAKSIADVSVNYDTSLAASVTAFQARQQIASGLTDEAVTILADAGLLAGGPMVY